MDQGHPSSPRNCPSQPNQAVGVSNFRSKPAHRACGPPPLATRDKPDCPTPRHGESPQLLTRRIGNTTPMRHSARQDTCSSQQLPSARAARQDLRKCQGRRVTTSTAANIGPQVYRAEAALSPKIEQVAREPEGGPDVVQPVWRRHLRHRLQEGWHLRPCAHDMCAAPRIQQVEVSYSRRRCATLAGDNLHQVTRGVLAC